eukprot:SAG31_NODE_718_length_12607_cov_21.723937_6_plen_77_part_00
MGIRTTAVHKTYQVQSVVVMKNCELLELRPRLAIDSSPRSEVARMSKGYFSYLAIRMDVARVTYQLRCVSVGSSRL